MSPARGRRLGQRGVVCSSVLMLSALAGCSGGGQAPVAQRSESVTSPPGAVRYVSPTGRDTWPGTKAQPWRTLRRALPALQAGQLLYVRGGDYHERLIQFAIHSGRPNKRIVVMAYPGERPVVRGLIWLRDPSYWTIDGLNVTWDPTTNPARRQMVKLTGGTGWIWQDSEIWGSRGTTNMFIAGFGRREPARWAVTGNCIHDVKPPAATKRSSNLAVGDMPAAGPGSVSRNLIFHAPGPYNVALGSTAGGAAGVSFDYNTVVGGQVALSVAGETTGLSIAKNILADVSSGLIVRWNRPKGSHNVITQNLGVKATAFMRPTTDAVVGGPGNVIDNVIGFSDVSTCHGFRPAAPAALPYGRYAVG